MKTKAIFLALSLSFAGCALNYQDVNFQSPCGLSVKRVEYLLYSLDFDSSVRFRFNSANSFAFFSALA
jgi:hypothetical protein